MRNTSKPLKSIETQSKIIQNHLKSHENSWKSNEIHENPSLLRLLLGRGQLHWSSDTGFSINGVATKILGTANHQDFAVLGVAVPDELQATKRVPFGLEIPRFSIDLRWFSHVFTSFHCIYHSFFVPYICVCIVV